MIFFFLFLAYFSVTSPPPYSGEELIKIATSGCAIDLAVNYQQGDVLKKILHRDRRSKDQYSRLQTLKAVERKKAETGVKSLNTNQAKDGSP